MLIHHPQAVWKVVQKRPAAAAHCSQPLTLPQDHVVFPPMGGETPRPPPLPAGHTLLGDSGLGPDFWNWFLITCKMLTGCGGSRSHLGLTGVRTRSTELQTLTRKQNQLLPFICLRRHWGFLKKYCMKKRKKKAQIGN